MNAGDKVIITGDRYGNNAGLDSPFLVGLTGTVKEPSTPGFWWVELDRKTMPNIVETVNVCETEIQPYAAP